jgi:hypothetical protein
MMREIPILIVANKCDALNPAATLPQGSSAAVTADASTEAEASDSGTATKMSVLSSIFPFSYVFGSASDSMGSWSQQQLRVWASICIGGAQHFHRRLDQWLTAGASETPGSVSPAAAAVDIPLGTPGVNGSEGVVASEGSVMKFNVNISTAAGTASPLHQRSGPGKHGGSPSDRPPAPSDFAQLCCCTVRRRKPQRVVRLEYPVATAAASRGHVPLDSVAGLVRRVLSLRTDVPR